MPDPSEIPELEAVRHDLRNVLTALRHGCTLIGSKLDAAEHKEAHEFLDEMRKSIEQGNGIVERLRSTGPSANESVGE